MNSKGQALEASLLQQNEEEDDDSDNEQPSASSMPQRFVALTNVNDQTNGRNHKIVHHLIKDTIEAMAENLMKYKLQRSMERSELVGAIKSIIGQTAIDDPKNQ